MRAKKTVNGNRGVEDGGEKGSSGKWSDGISKGVLTKKTIKTPDCWQALWVQSVFMHKHSTRLHKYSHHSARQHAPFMANSARLCKRMILSSFRNSVTFR